MTDPQGQQTQRKSRRRRERRTWIQWVGWVAKLLLLLLVLAIALLWFVYQSAQSIPDFYQESLNTRPRDLAESGARFEQRVLDLKSSAEEEGAWQIIFTEDQINGWLAVDMPRKFPKWQPKEIEQPRVAIDRQDAKLVFKLETPRLSGIVVASLDFFCTRRTNEIGIRFRSVRSGVLPIPVHRFADRITATMRESRVDVSWTEMDGDPVALVVLPDEVTRRLQSSRVILRNIEVQQDQIVLTGETVVDAQGD